MSCTLTRFPEEGGHRSVALHLWHVARLATALTGIRAMLPLLVRHLVRQFSNGLAALAAGDCVQRVASRAKSRIANLRGLAGKEASGRTLHYALMACIDNERPMLWALIRSFRRIDYEIADEAGSSAEVLFGDLVTHRAGDPVHCFGIALIIRIEREVGENLRLLILNTRLIFHDWHVAMRTFVLDDNARFRMVKRLSPHARLPVRIARGIRHDARPPIEADGEVLARFRPHAVVARDAAVGGPKLWCGR